MFKRRKSRVDARNIIKRGSPETGPDQTVHMHWTQNRPGLREGWDIARCDYMVNVLCRTGGFHIYMVWDEHDGKGGYTAEDLVTCPKCLAIMRGEEPMPTND